ncbi:MAG: YitT family protein, partial [Solobacterium sp.]|nr:YitT family protein [Solobacterium sp.]
ITIAIWNECATGGTDTIAYLIRHFFKNWELSKIIFVIDMIIVLSSFTISNKLYTSIYSAFSLIVIVITIHLLTKSKT